MSRSASTRWIERQQVSRRKKESPKEARRRTHVAPCVRVEVIRLEERLCGGLRISEIVVVHHPLESAAGRVVSTARRPSIPSSFQASHAALHGPTPIPSGRDVSA
jgi:hypothetical protein